MFAVEQLIKIHGINLATWLQVNLESIMKEAFHKIDLSVEEFL